MHQNNEYMNAYQTDNKVFRKYTGLCTNICDSAHRIGVK